MRQVASLGDWEPHNLTLPDAGVTGNHPNTLSIDTGPQYGVIKANKTFVVNDAPPMSHFDAWYRDGNISAYEWPVDTELTLDIEDPTTPQSPDYSTTTVVGVADWDPSQTFGQFHLNGAFEIQPGMT